MITWIGVPVLVIGALFTGISLPSFAPPSRPYPSPSPSDLSFCSFLPIPVLPHSPPSLPRFSGPPLPLYPQRCYATRWVNREPSLIPHGRNNMVFPHDLFALTNLALWLISLLLKCSFHLRVYLYISQGNAIGNRTFSALWRRLPAPRPFLEPAGDPTHAWWCCLEWR